MKRTFGALLTLCLATVTSAQITQIFTFPCPDTLSGGCGDGYRPNLLLQASDGNFYGAAQLTTFGSSNPNGGTLFRLTPGGQFSLLFTFKADANRNYVNGNNPAAALVEANDGFLYGASFEGGGTNHGVLFRISKSGSGFTVLHSFCSAANCPDGSIPLSLILGHDGNLYGTTLQGGSSASGTIFRFTPPGSFTTIHALNGTTDEAAPSGMIQGADGNFYGTISGGVFRFTPGGAFTVLTTFPPVDGFLPTSGDSPLVQGSNGKLYGALTTYSLNQVQFYEINPSGSGFQEFPEIGTLSVDFHIGSLIQASNGDLWTAFTDTANPNGVVVAMSPATGAVVQSFSFGGTNGSGPEAGAIQGADGKIYGTATGGGTVNGSVASGTVWSLDAGLPAPKPGIAAFSPTSGAVGSTVLIRGTKFVGTTAVTFNGISAVFQVLNAQFIRATVPAGGSTGLIEVTNAGGTAATAKAFAVQ
jgi:uncharacterized repeat protein (TIGR03803 family)